MVYKLKQCYVLNRAVQSETCRNVMFHWVLFRYIYIYLTLTVKRDCESDIPSKSQTIDIGIKHVMGDFVIFLPCL